MFALELPTLFACAVAKMLYISYMPIFLRTCTIQDLLPSLPRSQMPHDKEGEEYADEISPDGEDIASHLGEATEFPKVSATSNTDRASASPDIDIEQT